MKFNKPEWNTLETYIKSNTPLTEEMLRRSVSYIENAIYKPSFISKIIMAWDDYILMYLIEYKMLITCSLSILAVLGATIILWNKISRSHLLIIAIVMLYLYEVIISYKEAEQQELENFVLAMNKCKWFFWSSSCEVPPPNPLIFMKHMNPLKIGIRMFTSVISEPVLTISTTVEKILHNITDDLWFPFNKVVYGMLTIGINIMLILFLIMIIFNYILNIPFHLNVLGLFSVGVKQRRRDLGGNISTSEPLRIDEERISGATLNRLLDVCSLALSSGQSTNNTIKTTQPSITSNRPMRRSASTGRLPTEMSYLQSSSSHPDVKLKMRNKNKAIDGGGDGH